MTVFDLDDTLFKERDFVTSSFRVIAREADRRGIISYEKALAILCAGRDGGMAFSSLAEEVAARAPGCGLTEEWMVNTYRTHTPDIKLDDATESVLAALRERGETLGLITDGRSNTQRAKIKALGLERFIEPRNILVSGETGFDKTHREPFDMIMMRNPAERRYVYVGDNSAKDFIWPNKLGWLTVQLDDADGVNIHPQSSDRPAAFFAATPYRFSFAVAVTEGIRRKKPNPRIKTDSAIFTHLRVEAVLKRPFTRACVYRARRREASAPRRSM